MDNQKNLLIALLITFVVGLCTGLFIASPHSSSPSSDITSITTPTTHDVTMKAPLKAEDKTVLRKSGVISKKVEKDKNTEITSAAKIQNSSGTTYVSNATDILTGVSTLTTERPLAEWMNSNSIAFGFTAGSLGFGEKLAITRTFSRIGKFYTYVDLEGYHWIQKYNQKENYSGQIGAFMRLDF